MQGIKFDDQWSSFRKFEVLDEALKSAEAGCVHEVLRIADRYVNGSVD